MAALAICVGLCSSARAADDLLDQPRCLEARAELDAALQANAQDRRAHAQRLARAREQARLHCLGGGKALPAPPARVTAQPAAPVQTMPAPITPPQSPPRPATPTIVAPIFTPTATSTAAIPAPPPAITTPRVLGHCDGTGCWDNLGNRLQQGGGMTSSPNGLCSVQGNFAICP